MNDASCPFQNQTLCGLITSSSDTGRDTDDANSICPALFTSRFVGELSTSDGTLTVAFAANVAGSYSAISPGDRKIQRRFPCPTMGPERKTRATINRQILCMNKRDVVLLFFYHR